MTDLNQEVSPSIWKIARKARKGKGGECQSMSRNQLIPLKCVVRDFLALNTMMNMYFFETDTPVKLKTKFSTGIEDLEHLF